jgi:hypothetical protein
MAGQKGRKKWNMSNKCRKRKDVKKEKKKQEREK